jgi:APA family basic amino acid/polyamine antiporter
MSEQHLSRVIGPFSATMLGVGAMVGAGIFVLSGIAAGHAGPAVVLAFLLNGVVALAIGACYAELSAAMPRAGGSYFWAKQALGRRAGFYVGWVSLYANVVASALYALGFGAFSVALCERLGVTAPAGEIAFAAGITVAVSYLQYRGIGDLRIVENIITLLKVGLLLVIVVGGFSLLHQNPEPVAAFSDFIPNGWMGVLMAMAVTFVAFEGFEVITRTGEEMRQPERNMPIAIFASIFIAVSLYVLIATVLVAAVEGPGGMPAWQYLGQQQELGMAAAAAQLLPNGDIVFYIAGIASTASALVAATFSAIRVTFALARAGDLPYSLAKLHRQHHSPQLATLLCGILVLVMVVSLPIAEVAGAASQMFALLFALVCFACWRLRYTQPDLHRPFRIILVPVCSMIGILAGLVVILTLLKISPIAWGLSILWLVLGTAVFWFRTRSLSLMDS